MAMSPEEKKEKQRIKARRHYLANKEKYKENARKWKAKNREKVRESNRKYMEERGGKEKKAEYYKRWSKENRVSMALKTMRYYARKKGAIGSCTVEQWESRLEYYGGKCIYCGSSERIEAEHRIPLARGGTNFASNLIPACRTCNARKATMTESEYKDYINEFSA